MSYSWTCPYCNQATTITDLDQSTDSHYFSNQKCADGLLNLNSRFIVCPNIACKKTTVNIALSKAMYRNSLVVNTDIITECSLKPNSTAKSFPDYIPQKIKESYEEACLIKDLSPKASATLSRRCLQGMIRDFWGIKEKTLFKEIDGIHEKVDPVTWQTIDAIRQIGNIGAHMEKDINVITDVSEGEAEALIKLIESLIKDWYIIRYERKKINEDVISMAANKGKPAREEPQQLKKKPA